MPTYLPIKSGCEFYPCGSSAENYVLRTPDGRHFLVTNTTKEILESLGNRTPLEALCESPGSGIPEMPAAEVRNILERRYRRLGVLDLEQTPDGKLPEKRSWPVLPAFIRCWDIMPESVVSYGASYFTWLYTWPVLTAFAALNIVAHFLLYSGGPRHYTLLHGSSLAILFLSLLSILAHEFGHATALLRFGAMPGKIGFGFYILMPTFFADVSQVWRLPRPARYVVDLGGVYFQQAAFLIFSCGAIVGSSLECAAVCLAIDTMTLLALNPVFRFDGYWLLADWLGLPRLHRDALLSLKLAPGRVVAWMRRREWNGPRAAWLRLSGLKPAVFALYALFCNVFLFVALGFSWRYLKIVATGAFRHFPLQLAGIAFSARAGDWPTLADQLVTTLIAFLFTCTACCGIFLYLIRLTRFLRMGVSAFQIKMKGVLQNS